MVNIDHCLNIAIAISLYFDEHNVGYHCPPLREITTPCTLPDTLPGIGQGHLGTRKTFAFFKS